MQIVRNNFNPNTEIPQLKFTLNKGPPSDVLINYINRTMRGLWVYSDVVIVRKNESVPVQKHFDSIYSSQVLDGN